MRNDLLDDIHVINLEIDKTRARKRLLVMMLVSFLGVLIGRFFLRDVTIFEDSRWVIDFLGPAPLLNAFILNSVFAYYIYHYADEIRWNFRSFFISFVEFFGVMLLSRVLLYGFIAPIVLVMLGIAMEGEELQMFYKQNFWVDVLPLFTDIVVVFYFFNPIPQTREPK